jgi:hypothetical protein
VFPSGFAVELHFEPEPDPASLQESVDDEDGVYIARVVHMPKPSAKLLERSRCGASLNPIHGRLSHAELLWFSWALPFAGGLPVQAAADSGQCRLFERPRFGDGSIVVLRRKGPLASFFVPCACRRVQGSAPSSLVTWWL